MSTKPTVFLSSTYMDNAARRAALLDVARRAGFDTEAMEGWTADARGTAAICLEQARGADLFVGLLAFRYGWVPQGSERSITEMEYDAAGEASRPRLLFIVDSSQQKADVDADFDTGDDRWRLQEKLDQFKKRVRANLDETATPFTDGDLERKVFQALIDWKQAHWRGAAPAAGSAPAPAADAALPRLIEAYLEALDAEHDSLALAGFETRLRVPLHLRDLYVPLRARVDLAATRRNRPESGAAADDYFGAAAHPDGGGLAEASDEVALVDVFRASERFGAPRGFVLLGDPGSGKTTHLKRLVLWLTREGPRTLGLDPAAVPMFLPLRQLAPGDGSLLAFAERLLVGLGLGFDGGAAARLFQQRPVVFLLDGLDEVPDARRGEVRAWIERTAERQPQHRFVVTCRYAGYTDAAELGPQFLECHLRPLTPEQAEEFVRK